MDIFGTPTEIKISVMKAIAELQNTASNIFVYDKKICDHVEYDETDKKLLVKQTLYDLTFLGVLVQTGSSFALLQNLIVQVPSEASAIPWIDPRNQNENLKRAFELKQKKKVLGNVNSKVKYTNHKKKQNFEDKEKIETEIDSLFAFYFEEFKNIKTINNPESSKARTPSRLGSTGLDDDNIILQVSTPINDQTSKPMENVVENVQSKSKIRMAKEIGDNPNVYVSKRGSILAPSGPIAIPWIDRRNQNKNLKRRLELNQYYAAKKKRYAEIPENPEINTGPEDTTKMLPPNALLEEQVLGNVKSKVKYTNHKKKRNFEDKKKTYSPEKIDSLFAYYFEKYKNIKTINNPENSEERTLESTGLDDDNIILHVSAPINDQTSKPMENVVKYVQSNRKITMAKEIGGNPNVYVSKGGSILGSLGLKKANNIMSINALKDQEYSSRWKFTDPLVI